MTPKHPTTTIRIGYPDPHSPNNLVSSRRFTWISFVPLSLLLHFTKYSNCYLLLVSLIMLIPDVTPLSPMSAFGPLLFVIFISEIRVFLEEILAYKRDRLVNAQLVSTLLPSSDFSITTPHPKPSLMSWASIQPGTILILSRDSEIPCDCVLLSGRCKVDASKLDGEAALRSKWAVGSFALPSSLLEVPIANTADLYRFHGQLSTVDGGISVMSIDQLLLRGSVVREVTEDAALKALAQNTDSVDDDDDDVARVSKEAGVIAVAVYCGKNTKVELNAEKGSKHAKWTRMDAVINGTVLTLLGLQVAASVALAMKEKDDGHWYLGGGERPGIGKSFLTGVILLATLVPASLWVAREVIRLALAMRIESKVIGCNSKTLHDELGCVQHVVTDKTGTLTINKMMLEALVVRGHGDYEIFRGNSGSCSGSGNPTPQQSKSQESHLFNCVLTPEPEFVTNVRAKFLPTTDLISADISPDCLLTWLNLIFNHTCTTEQASSPDEAALVSLVHAVGLEFASEKRRVGDLRVLKMFEFSSERRMMTVVVGNAERVFVLSKGADSSLFRFANSENLAQIIDDLCLDGLRVLVLGGYEMSRLEWNELEGGSLSETELLLQTNFRLTGCVGLRDALQQGVSETLKLLKEAEISISMATGDKKETAVGVALSCGLLSKEAAIFTATQSGEFRLMKSGTAEFGIVVEGGEPLTRLFQDAKKFLAVLTRAKGAVFCRVTPGEKARIVDLIQRAFCVLAVGDGGNDVSMLLKANVGVGISASLEGNQAANAADYTIKTFCDLRTLLFIHGTSVLKRFTIFNKLYLFKNFILTLCQFLFAPLSGFSGQTVFEDWYLLGYNSVFCLLPLMVAACEAAPVSSYRTDTEEYINVRRNAFSGRSIFLWFLRGVATSYFLLYSTSLSLGTRPDGTVNDFVYFSVLLYTQLLLLVSVLTLTHAKFSWSFLALLIVYNLGMYALFVFVYDHIIWSSEKWRLKHVAVTIFSDANFWFTSFLNVSTLTFSEHAVRSLWRPYLP